MSRLSPPGDGSLLCRHVLRYLRTAAFASAVARTSPAASLAAPRAFAFTFSSPSQLPTPSKRFSTNHTAQLLFHNASAPPRNELITSQPGLYSSTSRLQFRRHISSCSITKDLYRKSRRREALSEFQRNFVHNESKPRDASLSGGKSEPAPNMPKPGEDSPGRSMRDRLGLDRLQDMSHRFHAPTKEELLAAATGFWSRLRVRFKWFSIRSVRPFNLDDISAFFSWILVGHVIWILVGTTTFVSLLILTLNTVFAQETLARWIGSYLTKSSGVKIMFESAIVPTWRDGVITFRNVFVSRRPGQKKSNVSKGSQTSAAAAAAAAALEERAYERGESEEEETNYTQYELSIDSINVTLSFARWFNGRGLLKDVEVKGIRGVIDRTSIEEPTEHIDPKLQRYQHQTGDFELESFKMDDLLVTMYQPNDFRRFQVSIYSADLPQLRKQWLFYDILSANHMSGSFDDSLFTIHPRQMDNFSGAQLDGGSNDGSSPSSSWKKQSRIRIDGLSIDHLNRGVEGPFGWINEGNVDIVADIMFPHDSDESIGKVLSQFYDRMEATVTQSRSQQSNTNPAQLSSNADRTINNDPSPSSSSDEARPSKQETPAQVSQQAQVDENLPLIMDLRIQLNSVHAAVPIFTRDLSYVNNALIRPIVAYLNSRRNTFIPINCRVVKRADEFDGSWTVFDSGLMEDLSRETYEAFARDVVDDQARMRRIKKVGLWSLQLAVQALFLGLAGNVA